MKEKLLFCLGLLLSFNLCLAQTGNHAVDIDWQIVKSEAVNVIYPMGMEAQAQRVATIINLLDKKENRISIGDKRKKVELILRNQTVTPNGFVTVAPFRSEFFCTPPQSSLILGTTNWLDVLAIHEYRHVQQYTNAKVGLTKLLYFLAGQGGWGIGTFLSNPTWYLEGDAVISETMFTKAGRGRTPFFTLQQRANAYAGKNYRYLKVRNGSYKDILPDQYRLGYMMLNTTRDLGGNEAPKKILRNASKWAGILYPFSRFTNKETGKSTRELYNLSWEENAKKWKAQLNGIQLIPTKKVLKNENEKVVTNYRFPRYLRDGTIICRKEGYQETDRLVLIKNGEEKKLTSLGISYDDYLNVGTSMAAWTEISNHARRLNKDYSRVIVYDLKKNEKTIFAENARHFSPAISKDDKQIAILEIDYDQNIAINIYTLPNKKRIKKISMPHGTFYARLEWTEDATHLISIERKDNAMRLVKINTTTDEITTLTDAYSHTIEGISVNGGQVYFTASYSGIDNVYSVPLDGSGSIKQITSVPVGAFEPTVNTDGSTCIFPQYSTAGYRLHSQSISLTDRNNIIVSNPNEMPIYTSKAIEEEGHDILENLNENTYPVQKYKRNFSNLKFHSWLYGSKISAETNIGVTASNLLDDVSLSVGLKTNINDESLGFIAKLGYAKFWPLYEATVSSGSRQINKLSSQNENTLSLSASVPLNQIKGNYTKSFIPKLSLNTKSLSKIVIDGVNYANRNSNDISFEISMGSLRRRALQNVGVKSGININAGYFTELKATPAYKQAIQTNIYFPGLHKNHYTNIRLGYQINKLIANYYFSDQYRYARGISLQNPEKVFGAYTTYGLPIGYPEVGVHGLFFMKRVRANTFFDIEYYTPFGNIENKKRYSYGLEFIFDISTLNLFEVPIGIRAVRTNTNGKNKFTIEPMLIFDF